MKPSPASRMPAVVRWTIRGLLGGAVLLLGGACSSELQPCEPPVPPGAKYRVTVLGETAASSKCHIAELSSTFEITAAQADASSGAARCSLTPANWAPAQRGLTVVRCQPSSTQMLGTDCEMKYPSTCEGLVAFYFYAPAGVQVDWGAPRIENAVFRVEDTYLGCIPDVAGCRDEYAVVLDRIQ